MKMSQCCGRGTGVASNRVAIGVLVRWIADLVVGFACVHVVSPRIVENVC